MARDAKKKYNAALTAAEASYSRAESNAHKALTEDLQEAMKEATRAADLEEAVKLQAAIESVRVAEAAARPQRPLCLPVGSWRVEFANGGAETCEIRTDGTAIVVEPQRKTLAVTPLTVGHPFVAATRCPSPGRWPGKVQ